MSSATNSHNYLCESWTRGVPVQSASTVQLSDQRVCRCHIVTRCSVETIASEETTIARFRTIHITCLFVKCGGYIILCCFKSTRGALSYTAVCVIQDIFNCPRNHVVKLPNLAELHTARPCTVSCEASCLCFDVEAQEGRRNRVSVERLTSGAVIADARCNLSILSLFTSLFSFFLNYLKCYLSNK